MNTERDAELSPEASAQPINGPDLPGQQADWAEPGQHFWVLGESLTAALKAAWQREETRQQLHKLQTGLQEVADQVGQTVKEVTASPQFRQACLEVDKATQPAQAAGQRAGQEIQPHLLTALRQLRSGVNKLISCLDPSAPTAAEPTHGPSEEAADVVKGSPPTTSEI